MKVVKARLEVKQALEKAWQSQATIGFVPTMGALHAGHMALVNQAKRENAVVVVSIFVNPTQFGPKEDYERYPRRLEDDLAMLSTAGVTIAFTPTVQEIYPSPTLVHFTAPMLTQKLCGKSRPGHFEGVMQVVSRLFHLVKPTRVYFGQKDWQQTVVIRQMLIDLCWNDDINLIVCPTVREDDGLALSSRNQYLSAEERRLAPKLFQTLQFVAEQSVSQSRVSLLTQQAELMLSEVGFVVDYVEIVDRFTLQALNEVIPNQSVILAAVMLGKTRLIDNILI